MKAEEWGALLDWHEPKEATGRPSPWWLKIARPLAADLAESEREAGILRSALAESVRLHVEAEAKVTALTKCVAQSSTQYREMVAELDDYKAHYDYYADEPVSASYGDMLKARERIEARREAEEAGK